jgi:hypothetical protein
MVEEGRRRRDAKAKALEIFELVFFSPAGESLGVGARMAEGVCADATHQPVPQFRVSSRIFEKYMYFQILLSLYEFPLKIVEK